MISSCSASHNHRIMHMHCAEHELCTQALKSAQLTVPALREMSLSSAEHGSAAAGNA